MKKKIPFIVNPTANAGHSKAKIKKLSENQEIDIYLTKKTGDATLLMKTLLQPPSSKDFIGVAGGDGTLSEAIQAWESSSHTAGILLLPIGSGNDFAKNFIANDSLEDFNKPESERQNRFCDLGTAKFYLKGRKSGRRFVNSMGIGLTGEIAFYANEAKRFLWGELIYVYALLKTVWKYQSQQMKIRLVTKSGETVLIDEKVYAICIGNGHTEGGKFRIAPKAVIDDGAIDVSILLHFPLWKLPFWLLRFLKGTHPGHQGIHYHQAQSVKVESSSRHRVHFDGEVISDVEKEIEVSVLEKHVKISGVLKVVENK